MPIIKYKTREARKKAKWLARERFNEKERFRRLSFKLVNLHSHDEGIVLERKHLVERFWSLYQDYHKIRKVLENEFYRSGVIKPVEPELSFSDKSDKKEEIRLNREEPESKTTDLLGSIYRGEEVENETENR